MKNVRFGFIVVCLIVFIACSKDSENSTPSTTGVTPPPTPVVDRSANLLAAGMSANDILSNDEFTKLRVEIAFVAGFRPTDDALDEFMRFLRAHTFKDDIEMVFNVLPTPDEETLTIQQIADIEAENRTVYNEGDTLGIYIYFANAPSDSDDEDEGLFTLGAVYRNTSMVIYESTIRRLAAFSSVITIADVETATINHEFGHLFGLVNLGTPAINDHEDPEAENHCNVPGCLMRAELQFGGGTSGRSSNLTATNELKASCSLSSRSVMKMLENNIATAATTSTGVVNAVPLDAECIRDIQANGGS